MAMAGSSVSSGRPPLFASEKPARVAAYAYRLFASTLLAGLLLIWLYRATHLPPRSSSARWWAWLGLSAAELWFGFYWVLTLSVRWSPVYRRTFPDQLARRYRTWSALFAMRLETESVLFQSLRSSPMFSILSVWSCGDWRRSNNYIPTRI